MPYAITKLDMRDPETPCPACGASMFYPTSCRCTFERRVFALAERAGLDVDVRPGVCFSVPEATRANVARVNAAMRALDDSEAWPVSGRFNVTERAMRRVRRIGATDWAYDGLLSYVLAVDAEASRIVNDPRTL